MIDDIAFITLSNTGYINYTLNCYESLKRLNMSQLLKTYVIGKDGYEIINNCGYICSLIDDEVNSNFQKFREGNWSDITFYKFHIIYENLQKYKYVCFTDGDIVFENKDIFEYLKNKIESFDILIQNDTNIDNNNSNLCSGFMFINSNENTLSIFNPENVKLYKKSSNWGDQKYINEIKKNINYKLLPLELFPNGKYYFNNKNTNFEPYLIHFNWVIGHNKEKKMREYKKWYLNNGI